MNTNIKVSVLTPVYNRADRIHRVFDSLEKSTFQNFELIILDDGSTDNLEEVVNRYKEKVSYPVTFLRQENRGKHAAMNVLHQLAKGEYIFQLDSDDEITPQALEKTLETWASIDPAQKDDYWCVVGSLVDQHGRIIQSKPFPEGINDLDWSEAQEIARKIPGDKGSLQRTDILQKYKFPEPKGVKFVTENVVWNLIQRDYKEYLTNEVLKVYYLNEGDCLSSQTRTLQWAKNTYFNRIHMLNRGKIYIHSFIGYWKSIVHASICFILIPPQDRPELEKPSLKNKLAMALFIPPLFIGLPLIKKKIGWVG